MLLLATNTQNHVVYMALVSNDLAQVLRVFADTSIPKDQRLGVQTRAIGSKSIGKESKAMDEWLEEHTEWEEIPTDRVDFSDALLFYRKIREGC
jgi:hypothetical protein